jgi:hypothetical protein
MGEEYYLHLVPLVIEHPKMLLFESKNLTTTMTKLYRASSDFIGDASLNVEQRSIYIKGQESMFAHLSERPLGNYPALTKPMN